MQVKFPPLINVDAEFAGVQAFGAETVTIELNIGKKVATITLSRPEATDLMMGLKTAGITLPVNLAGITLPKK